MPSTVHKIENCHANNPAGSPKEKLEATRLRLERHGFEKYSDVLSVMHHDSYATLDYIGQAIKHLYGKKSSVAYLQLIALLGIKLVEREGGSFRLTEKGHELTHGSLPPRLPDLKPQVQPLLTNAFG